MIGYAMFGTRDLPRAAAFYDALLGELGATRAMESDRYILWASGSKSPMLGVVKPFDGNDASVGNGTMIALVVDSNDKVDRIYKKAIELGAKDEGPAGPRGDTFYVGYFRDLDGNKLNVVCMATTK